MADGARTPRRRGSRKKPEQPPRWTPEWWLSWFPVLMRFGALAGVAHQAIWEQFDRPYLLALYGAMLGLSEVAEAVRENRNGGGGG